MIRDSSLMLVHKNPNDADQYLLWGISRAEII